jgi:putative oxidoreductase
MRRTRALVFNRFLSVTTRTMINDHTAPFAALLLRLSLGILFLAHVGLKLFVFTVPGFVGYFASLGLPAVAAYLTIALELVGGFALILGVCASWVALPLAAEMVGTIVLVHGANGWMFANKGGGWEYPAFWAVALIVLFLLGDGAYALRPAKRRA